MKRILFHDSNNLGAESGDISKEGGRIIPSNANIQRSPRGLFLIIVYYRDDVTDWLRFALAVLFPRGFKADRAKRVNFAASACLDATKKLSADLSAGYIGFLTGLIARDSFRLLALRSAFEY